MAPPLLQTLSRWWTEESSLPPPLPSPLAPPPGEETSAAPEPTAPENNQNLEIQTLQEERDRLARENKILASWFETSALPLWRLNEASELIWCNQAYADLFTLPIEDVLAKGKRLISKEAVQGTSVRQHHVIKGQRRLFTLTERPMPDGGGTLGRAIDVTREEELESALKRQQTASKELLEQLHTAIALFGQDQRLEFFNSAFAQLWGLEEQTLNQHPKLGDILEKLREMRLLPEQADFRTYKQSWLQMFTNLLDPFEDLLHLPSDKTLRMLVIPNPAGGLMFTFEDVTSRLQLETSYNTLLAVQRETLDNLSEGIVVFGGDGRLKLWNPAFAGLWHLHPEDLDGEPHVTRLIERLEPLFSPADWPAARNNLLAQALNGIAMKGRLIRHDDRLIAYATTVLPDGGVLMSHIDVTDSVHVETALRERNSALEAAERLKLDFLANVSYQLRTPLNAIMGFTEILDNEYFGPLNPKQKQYTQGTKEASERLLSLIDDILDLSTIEAGHMKLERETFPVRTMMETLYDLTVEWARKEGIEVRLEKTNEDPGRIEADPRRIKQILLNLIRNAISFTPSGGYITLAAQRKNGEIHLAVGDTGAGIAPEDHEKIFGPFERGNNLDPNDPRRQGGAGLGLTLVRNIAALHGGRVEIESAPGKGTVVTVVLPVTAPADEPLPADNPS